jgi:hypothetical protein
MGESGFQYQTIEKLPLSSSGQVFFICQKRQTDKERPDPEGSPQFYILKQADNEEMN